MPGCGGLQGQEGLPRCSASTQPDSADGLRVNDASRLGNAEDGWCSFTRLTAGSASVPGAEGPPDAQVGRRQLEISRSRFLRQANCVAWEVSLAMLRRDCPVKGRCPREETHHKGSFPRQKLERPWQRRCAVTRVGAGCWGWCPPWRGALSTCSEAGTTVRAKGAAADPRAPGHTAHGVPGASLER